MSWLEPTAAGLGVLCLFFLIRQSMWAWPVGIAMTGLYAIIFFDVRLYSDFGLQLIFCVLQAYGWWFWLSHRDRAEADSQAPVIWLGFQKLLPWLAVGAVGALALGLVMDRFTDADLPYWDAMTTSFSLVAQFMLARKYLENWLVWIGVDVVAIGVYAYKGLMLTSGLYALFLLMCVWGFWQWRRDSAVESEAAPAQ
jgi:nicotinamide mononucleotide transporter